MTNFGETQTRFFHFLNFIYKKLYKFTESLNYQRRKCRVLFLIFCQTKKYTNVENVSDLSGIFDQFKFSPFKNFSQRNFSNLNFVNFRLSQSMNSFSINSLIANESSMLISVGSVQTSKLLEHSLTQTSPIKATHRNLHQDSFVYWLHSLLR